MASGFINSAPHAPSPPALATATDSAGGQAPAMGARRMGSRMPRLSANAWARARGLKECVLIRDVLATSAPIRDALYFSRSILSMRRRMFQPRLGLVGARNASEPDGHATSSN